MKKTKKEALQKRNRPLKRIRLMFIIMFAVLAGYISYYTVIISPNDIMNDYNPRLDSIENNVIRGPILDRNGEAIVTTVVKDGVSIRSYPYQNNFSHVIGYIGHGKNGIEAYSNLDLLDTNSSLIQRISQSISTEKPMANAIKTTLDTELQLLARQALGDNKGAIIALEPSTGKVLAMVSTPDYDPNNIGQNYDAIASDVNSATLLNRATQGLYPPGSTYKIITTMAYLEEHASEDFFYYCLGEDIIGQKKVHCYNNTVHGRMGLEEAFALSCNTSFAHIGQNIDPDRLKEISEIMGYNDAPIMEIETSKSQFVLNSDSSGPEVSETSIGQGKTLTTPLNNVMLVSAIANKGTAMKPFIVDQILDDDGSVLETTTPSPYRDMVSVTMATLLESYMITTSKTGTAKALNNDLYEIASKTGSAQNPQGDAHAWYVGYAPVDNPSIAIAIVVENVGSSSLNAVPIAKEIYDHYLQK